MGIAYNTSIVMDGLLFYLDAANPRCYSGSGTSVMELTSGIGATLVNGVGFNSANNGSFVFDGSNDYINCGLISNTFNSLSVEVMFKIGILNKKQSVISTYDNSLGWGIELLDNTSNNAFNFFGFTSSGIYTSIQSTSSGLLNQLYFITGVFSGSNSISIYINGTLNNSVNTNYSSISKFSTSNLQLGDDPNTQSLYLQGNVFSAKLYNRALSAAEIKTNYNGTKKRYGL
jgi:hypothetical protein